MDNPKQQKQLCKWCGIYMGAGSSIPMFCSERGKFLPHEVAEPSLPPEPPPPDKETRMFPADVAPEKAQEPPALIQDELRGYPDCSCDCHPRFDSCEYCKMMHVRRNAAPAPLPEPAPPRAEQLAERFHETYERLAPQFNYETRKASAVPWEKVPENNKRLMISVCSELLADLPGFNQSPPAAPQGAQERDWTIKDGRSNSSDLFVTLCSEVARLIRGEAHSLINGNIDSVARLILAQLAHVHHLAPAGEVESQLAAAQKELDIEKQARENTEGHALAYQKRVGELENALGMLTDILTASTPEQRGYSFYSWQRVYQLTCEYRQKHEQHLKHVQQFLNDMFHTLVDPVDDFGGTISEMCALLLKTATEHREIARKDKADLTAANERIRLKDDELWQAVYTLAEKLGLNRGTTFLPDIYRAVDSLAAELDKAQRERDEILERANREAQLACDLRNSQDVIIERCAKVVENLADGSYKQSTDSRNALFHAVRDLRAHVDGISGEDWGELKRERDSALLEAKGLREENARLKGEQ